MRWISFVTFLGAALLPTASARPRPCFPQKPTTTSVALSASTTAATVETLSTDTATASSTAFVSTTALETTTAKATTTTIAESTTTTVAETTTTTAPAESTGYAKNGGFENTKSPVWTLTGGEIINNPSKAHSGDHYAQLEVSNEPATGHRIDQTLTGLNTQKTYVLTFFYNVFSTPTVNVPVDAACLVQSYQDETIIGQYQLIFSSEDQWMTHSTGFIPTSESVDFSLRLWCSTNDPVTMDVGLDDISIVDYVPSH